MKAKPGDTVVLGEYQYELATVIYTNEAHNHFFSHTFLQGRPLLYDGLRKSRRLQWHTLPAYRSTDFPISYVWYKKSRHVEPHVTSLPPGSSTTTNDAFRKVCSIHSSPRAEARQKLREKRHAFLLGCLYSVLLQEPEFQNARDAESTCNEARSVLLIEHFRI